MLDEERGSPRSIGGDPHLWDVELSSIGRLRHVTDSRVSLSSVCRAGELLSTQ